MDSFQIKVLQGSDGFYDLKEEWKYIADTMRNATFFHQYKWHKSYFEMLMENNPSLFFLLVLKNNLPAAIIPFEKKNVHFAGFKLRILKIPDYFKSDHPLFDFVYEEAALKINLIKFLTDHLSEYTSIKWDCIILLNILETSSVGSSIRKVKLSKLISENGKNCFFFDCKTNQDIKDQLSRKFRQNLNNSLNRLKKLNNFDCRCITDKEEVRKSFKEFLEMESSGWKGKRSAKGVGEAMKLNTQEQRWFERILEIFSKNNNIDYNILSADNKVIAAQINLRIKNTIYGLKMAYDEEYSKYSPSNALMYKVIERYSKDENIDYFNTLTDAGWVTKWNPKVIRGYNYFIFNHTLLGLIFYLCSKSPKFLKIYKKYVKKLD